MKHVENIFMVRQFHYSFRAHHSGTLYHLEKEPLSQEAVFSMAS